MNEKCRQQSETSVHSILPSLRFVQRDILDTIVFDFSLHVVIFIEIKFIFYKHASPYLKKKKTLFTQTVFLFLICSFFENMNLLFNHKRKISVSLVLWI